MYTAVYFYLFFMQRKKNMFIGTTVLKFSVDKHMYTEDIWIVKWNLFLVQILNNRVQH